MSEPNDPRPPSGNNPLPPKRDVAMALLEADSVFVHLDPRHDNVRVPPWFKKQPRLVLQIGLNMAVPIRDLDVGEHALGCTLSFNRRPHYCYVPWKAVFALVNEQGRGMVWPDDVPPELVAQAQKQHDVAKRRASLRAVGSEGSAKRDTTPNAEASGPSGDNAGSTERVRPAQVKRTPPTEEASANPSLAVAPSPPSPTDKQNDEKAETEPISKRGRSLPPYLRVVK